MELLDLPYDVGMSYLHKHGLPDELSKRVISFAGSWMLFLSHAALTYKLCKNKDMDHVFDEIIGDLHQTFVWKGIKAVIKERPLSLDILKDLQEFDDEIGFELSKYSKSCEDWDMKHEKVVDGLMNGNVLRYMVTSDSKSSSGKKRLHVTWHNQLIKKELIELFEIN